MEFEWDPKKAETNQKKHKISFELAVTAFDDPYALIAPDPKHSSSSELREWLIGESDKGVLVIVFTQRKQGRFYRIISARKANRQERTLYEEYRTIPI
jgi:uncharacterized protein